MTFDLQQPFGNINSTEFQFKWRINMDSDEVVNKVTGQKVISPTFITHSFGEDTKWHIHLFPKGEGKEVENYISIYIYSLNSFEVKAAFTLRLINKHKQKVKEVKFPKFLFSVMTDFNCGIQKFLERNSLNDPANNVRQGGEITFELHISIENIVIEENKSFSQLKILDDFEKLLLEEKFSDLTVVSSNRKKFHVHKGVLAHRSPVFKAMFDHDMIENNQNVLKIQDIKNNVLLEVFRFIYSGKVNKIESMIFELMCAADKYCIEGLKLLCEETLLLSLNKANAIDNLIEADRNNCDIVKTIIKYIAQHDKDFVRMDKFKSLMTTHPNVVYEIMNMIVYEKKKK